MMDAGARALDGRQTAVAGVARPAGKSNAAHERYATVPRVQRAESPATQAARADTRAAEAAFAAAVRPDLCESEDAASGREAASADALIQRQEHDYPGAYESLSRDGAATLDDAALQAGMQGARRELVGLDPASAEYGASRGNLAALQWEAAQRGVGEDGVLPDGHGRVGPGGVVLFDDPVHCRFVLEQQIAAAGMEAARAFVRRFRAMAGDEPRPAGPAEIGEHDGAIIHVLELQLAVLEREVAAFEAEFEREAMAIAHRILVESELRVKAEMARYGMDVNRAWGFAGARASGGPETRDMQMAARTLLDSQRELETLQARRAARLWHAEQPALGEYPIEDDDRDVGPVERITPAELVELAELDAQVEAAQLEHARLRTEVEAEHPALARYTATDQLERVTQDGYGAMQVAWDLDGNLVNIETTRAALGDELSVFRLPQIVEMARQQLMVVPGSVRDRVIAERVEVDEPSVFEQIAVAALAIALGLLAAPPTGGTSLAAAGSMAALATAGFALDAYLAYDAVRDYRIAEAASGTDPDKARALSQADPSLFWLAVELIGAGLGAAAAVKTFGALARARRAALAATGAEEVAKHLDEIKLLTEGAGLSDDVGERLAKQVLDEHVDVAVAARARVAAKGRRAARGQLTDAIPAHPSARLGEPTKAEILALRAQYKLDSDSEAAALWHVLHQRSTRDVVAGEDAIKRVFGIDVKKEGEKMADLLKVDNRGLKVPVEVKNGKRITISGEGNSAIGKFENIAKHADMEGITHFEIICNTASKLEPNFKLGRDGTLYRLVSGSHPPEWEQVLIGGKKVYVKAGNLGEISQ